MKTTLKQKHLDFLKSHGWVEDPTSRTTKYLALTKPGKDYRYFLGVAGAVRRGRTVSNSISVKLKIEDPKDAAYQKAADETIQHDAKQEVEHRPDPTAPDQSVERTWPQEPANATPASSTNPAVEKSLIRVAIRKPNGCTEPRYGTPVLDGGLIDTDGFRHEPGTWFRSRQADGDGSDDPRGDHLWTGERELPPE